MDNMKNKIHRTPLVCKFCQKLDTNLSVHLQRVCQKKAHPSQIAILVEEARSNMRMILQDLSIINYADPSFRSFSPVQMEELVSFFEKSGVLVKGKPSPTVRPLQTDREDNKRSVSLDADGEDGNKVKKENLCASTSSFTVPIKKEMEEEGLYDTQIINKSGSEEKPRASTSRDAEGTSKRRNREEVKEEVILPQTPQNRIVTAKSPEECLKLLVVAKPGFCECIQKAKEDQALDETERLTILYYLEAVVILGLLQRPSVVHDLTVSEWLQRTPYQYSAGDKVVNCARVMKNHKTATQQVVYFVLHEEEEMWFDVYFKKVRPTFFHSKIQDSIYFFISTTGEKIYNASNDLSRFHQKYDLTPITSQEIRDITETYVSSSLTDDEKSTAVKYSPYTNTTAENFCSRKNADFLVMASRIINRLISEEKPQASTSRDTEGPSRKRNREEVEDKDDVILPQTPQRRSKVDMFSAFKNKYPLHMDKDLPPLKDCLQLDHGRYCYDRWRKAQNQMRMDDIIGHFHASLPDERQIAQYVELQGWKQNIPRTSNIMANWKLQRQKKLGQHGN